MSGRRRSEYPAVAGAPAGIDAPSSAASEPATRGGAGSDGRRDRNPADGADPHAQSRQPRYRAKSCPLGPAGRCISSSEPKTSKTRNPLSIRFHRKAPLLSILISIGLIWPRRTVRLYFLEL